MLADMKSFVLFQSSSLIPLLLITSFLSINFQSSLSAADTAEYANCSQPITCGSVTSNISYPFWGENRPKYCGKSGYEVTCESNVPKFSMRNITFRILDMNNSTNTATPTVKVAREDYYETICPSEYIPTNLNFSLFDYSSGLLNITFWYGCNTTISSLGNSKECNSSISASYLTQTGASTITVDPVSTGACKAGVLIPVYTATSAAIDRQTMDIQTAIDGGFELEVVNGNDTNTLCRNCFASGGACGQNTTTSEFLCLCQTTSSSTTVCTDNSISSDSTPRIGSLDSNSRWIILIIGISAAILIVLCIIYKSRKNMIFFFLATRKNMIFTIKEERNELDIDTFIRNYGSMAPKRYSYADVVKMTNSFEHQTGKGGFGTVYKGKLPDGLPVAVKLLSESKGDGEEFINEVASIHYAREAVRRRFQVVI